MSVLEPQNPQISQGTWRDSQKKKGCLAAIFSGDPLFIGFDLFPGFLQQNPGFSQLIDFPQNQLQGAVSGARRRKGGKAHPPVATHHLPQKNP